MNFDPNRFITPLLRELIWQIETRGVADVYRHLDVNGVGPTYVIHGPRNDESCFIDILNGKVRRFSHRIGVDGFILEYLEDSINYSIIGDLNLCIELRAGSLRRLEVYAENSRHKFDVDEDGYSYSVCSTDFEDTGSCYRFAHGRLLAIYSHDMFVQFDANLQPIQYTAMKKYEQHCEDAPAKYIFSDGIISAYCYCWDGKELGEERFVISGKKLHPICRKILPQPIYEELSPHLSD